MGERHIFVRFQGCDLDCSFCDTPAANALKDGEPGFFSAQVSPGYPAVREQLPNPVSPARLTALCSRLALPGPAHQTISLTGGEPLLHADFLADWLPSLGKDYRIFLETGGIHAVALKKVINCVDVVSMDFKLPSSTNLRPYWVEHERFLEASTGHPVVAKAVVSKATSQDDVLAAARILAAYDDSLPLILQPAAGARSPEMKALFAYQEAALAILRDVRVIPQMHKMMKVP